MDIELSSRNLDVGDDRIHYVTGGRRQGLPPIVLVHGLSGDTTWWRKNIGPLCELTEVHALDLPGFGDSPTHRPFSIEAEYDALAGWLDALKVEQAIVVGHSLGGYLSALLAARLPGRVAGLVLIDPAIFPSDYGWTRLSLGLFGAPFHLSLDFIPTLLRGSSTAGLARLLQVARELLGRVILNELGAIRAQTLLLWGDGDTVVPLVLITKIMEAMTAPVTGPVVLHGGHVAMWDDTETCNNAIADFAKRFRQTP